MLGKSLAHERVAARATMRQSECATVTVTGGDGDDPEPPEPPEPDPFDPLPLVAGAGALGALFFLMR
jgi:hypothetical protein